MRRGLKAWCERVSEEYRSELGISLSALLEPEILAKHLEVMVWHPKDIPGVAEDVINQLTVVDRDSWSAVTLNIGNESLIIVNSSHPATRRRNSLAHEIAHLLLKHDPTRIDVSKKGYLLMSSYEGEQEKEADWLAGSLLVPREGLRMAYHFSQDSQVLADRFGVSTKLVLWRLRMTGILVQAKRARAYRSNRARSARMS